MAGDLELTWAESESFAMDSIEQANKQAVVSSSKHDVQSHKSFENGISPQLNTIIKQSHEQGQLSKEMEGYAKFAVSIRGSLK